jgi:hypothetical protein
MADYDLPTRSASGFMLRHIAPRMEPMHLFQALARRVPFELAAPQSDFILIVGHGSENAISGQNDGVILEVGKYNSRLVSGKVIKLMSCDTAILLGPDLIENGARAYFGYADDFVWIVDADLWARPWADKAAALAFMPVIDSLNALLDGKTCAEAFDIELDGYHKNLELTDDELVRSCLEFNRANARLLGDPDARITARPKIHVPIPPPPIILPIRSSEV